MSRFVRPVLVVVLCAVAFTVLAAQQPKETEKPKSEKFFIVQEIVKPSMIKEYEAASKQLIHEFEQYKIDPAKVSWFSVSGMEMGYVYVMPINDFASIEPLHENFMSAINTIGMDRWEEIDARINKCLERRAVFIATRLSDLSYEAAKPACPPDEVEFIQYTFLYATPGKEQQLEELAGKFRDLYAKHNISQSWTFHKKVTGDDLPLYVVIEGARNEAELDQLMENAPPAFHAEAEKLFSSVMSCVRRMEEKSARTRLDLSYPNPATAATTN